MKLNKICPIGDEDIVLELRPSKIVLGFYLGGLVAALVAVILILAFTGVSFLAVYIGLLLIFALVGWVLILNWIRTVYYITDQRVKSCSGIVGSSEHELTYDDVQSVEVHHTFWGAIFGFGTIVIEASGQERDVTIANISNPKNAAQKISRYSGSKVERG